MILNQNNLTNKNTFYRNYTKKIVQKPDIESEDHAKSFNDLIILLNFCFNKKNNFFIKNFNKVKIGNISKAYNQMKTNILSNDNNPILFDINPSDLKIFLFIIRNFNYCYLEISKDTENQELCSLISKSSLDLCSKHINSSII
jgi:hypothetical protein